MTTSHTTASDVDVDLGRLFASLARDWRRIVVVALAFTLLAFAVSWMLTPKYKGETRLLIETRESEITRIDRNGDRAAPILDGEGIASQVEVISSSDILRKVASDLDLASRDEFDASPSLLGRALIMVGLKADVSSLPPEDRVLESFREKLEIYRVENSRVIVIEFSSEDPRLASAVSNAIADAYVEAQEAAKRLSNNSATAWLEPEIVDLRERVREAEAKVAEYRGTTDLLVGDNNSVLATQQLSEMSSELSRVRANRSAAEAKAASVRAALDSGAPIEAIPDVLASSLIQRLREREVELRSEIADLSTTLLPNHPRVRALNAQIADLDQQIRSEARKVLAGLENEAETARAREASLVADVNGLKAASARADGDAVELRALEREAAAQRELLESYLTRFREASSRVDRNYLPADVRVFSRASIPLEPYFPKILPIVISAFVASLLLMAVFTLLRELFSGRAMRPAGERHYPEFESVAMPVSERPAEEGWTAATREQDEAEDPAPPVHTPAVREDRLKVEDVPPLAPRVAASAVPGVERAADRPLPPRVPERPLAPRFDVEQAREDLALATGLRTSAPANAQATAEPLRRTIGEVDVERAAESLIAGGANRAVFVSPEGDEGAAASVLVAREIADSGLRCILLDLTSSGAASLPMLDTRTRPGITDLLVGEAQFADIIHPDLYSACHVLPVGRANAARAMRAAERLPIILDSLETAYDIVVVECGATGADAIARLLGDDTAIMVSAVEPSDRVADAAAELAGRSKRKTVIVSASSHMPPRPGRSAA